MAGLASLFSSSSFRGTIQRYCSDQGWKIAEINEVKAVLRFRMDSGRSQTLYIIRYDSTLEFSVPSALNFSSIDDVPHYVSTLLLKRNREPKVGFWCIEEIGRDHVFSVMHNAEMQLIDSTYFARVVRVLINECDELEGVIEDMLR